MAMSWNGEKIQGTDKKGDTLYIYISDSDRTTNLLQNVMGISKETSDPSQGTNCFASLTSRHKTTTCNLPPRNFNRSLRT